jgi:hypothetical protein
MVHTLFQHTCSIGDALGAKEKKNKTQGMVVFEITAEDTIVIE